MGAYDLEYFQMSTKYRADLNATTMLGQSKTVIQVNWTLNDAPCTTYLGPSVKQPCTMC